MQKNITVVIPFYDGHRFLDQLLASLPVDMPVVIVDDHSNTPLSETAVQEKRAHVRVIKAPHKGSFAGAVNYGIANTNGDILVLNQDVRFTGNGWIDLLEENRQQFAMIGDGVFGHPAWPNGYVQGTFMFMRRDAIDAVGSLNEKVYPLWGGTCEWQLRACRRGFKALPIKPVPGMVHERGENAYGSSISSVVDKANKTERSRLIRTPPHVSVIVTSYNYGRFLTDAVNSLVGGETSLGHTDGQTFQSFEIIIVNDASQDDTASIGKALADPWKGIHYVELSPAAHSDGMPNNGTSSANNAGIASAHGRYVTILCADDMYGPERIERMVKVIEGNPKAVVYDDMFLFAHGARQRKRVMPEYDFELLLDRNHMHAGIMITKGAWQKVGGYPEAMRYGREDWAMNVALGIAGYCGVRIDYPGYLYRREGQGRTTRNADGDWRSHFVTQMRELFPLVYSGERPMGCCGKGGKSMRNSGRLTTSPAPSAAGFAGKDGMVVLEYLGANTGTQLWAGLPNTGRRYEFGGIRPTGYVSAADADHMVANYWKANKPLFRIVPREETSAAYGSVKASVSSVAAAAVNPPAPPVVTPPPHAQVASVEEAPSVSDKRDDG